MDNTLRVHCLLVEKKEGISDRSDVYGTNAYEVKMFKTDIMWLEMGIETVKPLQFSFDFR